MCSLQISVDDRKLPIASALPTKAPKKGLCGYLGASALNFRKRRPTRNELSLKMIKETTCDEKPVANFAFIQKCDHASLDMLRMNIKILENKTAFTAVLVATRGQSRRGTSGRHRASLSNLLRKIKCTKVARCRSSAAKTHNKDVEIIHERIENIGV